MISEVGTLAVKTAQPRTAMSVTTLGGITTRVFRTLSEIEEVRAIWELWSDHPNADIDFVLMNIATEPNNPRPHIIVAYRNGKPECMLVGRCARRPVEFKIGYKTVLKPKAKVLGFVYAGLLGRVEADAADHLVRSVSDSLANGEADAAFFMLVRRNSALFNSIMRIPGSLFRDHWFTTQLHRGMNIPASVQAFYEQLSAKARKNLKWQSKKFVAEHAGKVQIQCFQSTRELNSAINDVEAIASKTYQRALGVGFADTPAMRERLLFEAERGWLRIYVLYASGKPCAFWIATMYRQTFHSDYMGFDPEYGKYSPGMFLITTVIEKMCEFPSKVIRDVDFGHGDAQYKAVLATREWEEVPLFIFGSSARGLILALLRSCTGSCDHAARFLVKRAGFLQRAKKLWRHIRLQSSTR